MFKIGIIGNNFGRSTLLPVFSSITNCEAILMNRKNWEKAINSEKFDALALAVPPDIQFKIARIAINKNINIFAEKPLSANLTQARKLLSLVKKKKITNVIDFMFPEIAEWVEVKKMIDGKVYGKLNHVSVVWNWLSGDIKYRKSTWKTDIKRGGGALSFYFSHGFHYLEYFAGKISDIKSMFTYSPSSINKGEVGVDLLFKFKNGTTGDAHVSCNTRGIISHKIQLQCEKATIVLEGKNTIVDDFKITVHKSDGTSKKIYVKKDSGIQSVDERVKIVRKLAERFITACKAGKQASPSFIEGVRVQELIEAARNNSI